VRKIVRPRLVLGTAAAACALALLTPTAAHAATGGFSYTAADGGIRTSGAPPSGECLAFVGKGPVNNNTDAAVSLFRKPGCHAADRIIKLDAEKAAKKVDTFRSAFWSE
jgi:hypothetical protein